MKFKTCWVRNNGNTLWLHRRIIFFFRYAPFSNKERELEKKMNKLVKELEDTYSKYCDTQAEKTRIHKSINKSYDTREDQGPVEIMKLNLFKPSIIPPQPDDWRKYENVMRGKGSIAEEMLGVSSVKPKRRGFHPHFEAEEVIIAEDEDFSIVAEQSVPIIRKNDDNGNRNKRKGGQQNQNN